MTALQIQNLNLTIKKKKILTNISFSVPPNKITALVGENGSGKTSIISCILGLYNWNGTAAKSFGKNLLDYKTRGNISFVPNKKNFNKVSAREWIIQQNVYYGHKISAINKRINTLIKKFNLNRKILAKSLPILSDGQKQIIMIISSIVSGCPIVIMDEPTENLDPIMRMRFFKLINQYKSKVTFVISTHNLDEINHHLEHLIVIKNGKVVFEGDWIKTELTLREKYEKFWITDNPKWFKK